jgi:hypothetical protein
MESAQNPYSHPYNPGEHRLVRGVDPRKPLWSMSHLEKLSRAVETGLLPRRQAEQALSTKDPAIVFNGLQGLGTAMLLGSKRWTPTGPAAAGLFPESRDRNPISPTAYRPAQVPGVARPM